MYNCSLKNHVHGWAIRHTSSVLREMRLLRHADATRGVRATCRHAAAYIAVTRVSLSSAPPLVSPGAGPWAVVGGGLTPALLKLPRSPSSLEEVLLPLPLRPSIAPLCDWEIETATPWREDLRLDVLRVGKMQDSMFSDTPHNQGAERF